MAISRAQITELVVASALIARALPRFDHDEIGVSTMTCFDRMVREGETAAGEPTTLVTAAALAETTIARLTALDAAVAKQDRSTIDIDKICRMRSEGMLLMYDAGGSAHDPLLLGRTLDNLNTACIAVHADEALTASLGRDVISSACLLTLTDTHRVVEKTITVEASLYTVAVDGAKARVPVLVTFVDATDPMCTPTIAALQDGLIAPASRLAA